MTTLVRWEPFRELASLQGDMNRWLNGFETDNEVVYAFDLPGIPEDKIQLEVKDDTLTVSAEREETEETSDERYYRFERRYGSFSRAVGIPQGVNEDQINAFYDDGVLEVRVPKPQEQKPKRIELTKTLNGKAQAA
jgi:HSP20 family protein